MLPVGAYRKRCISVRGCFVSRHEIIIFFCVFIRLNHNIYIFTLIYIDFYIKKGNWETWYNPPGIENGNWKTWYISSGNEHLRKSVCACSVFCTINMAWGKLEYTISLVRGENKENASPPPNTMSTGNTLDATNSCVQHSNTTSHVEPCVDVNYKGNLI